MSSAEMMRKALDEHKMLNSNQAQYGASSQNDQARPQSQQPPLVTNIINNNNINNFFI